MPCLYVANINVFDINVVGFNVANINVANINVAIINVVVQNQYAMNMIGHHHKFAQFNIFGMVFYFIPNQISNNPRIGQYHSPLHNFAEIMDSVFGTYRYKIGSFAGVVPILESSRGYSVFILVFIVHRY